LTGSQIPCGQAGQNINYLGMERVSKNGNVICRHFTAADFPIGDHIPRYRCVKGMQLGCELLLGEAVLFPNFADASSDMVLDSWIHTWMAAPRVRRGERVCF